MDKIIEVTLHELRSKKTQLVGAVAEGAAKDYAEYKGMCGEIRGLTAIEYYLIDLANKMEQADD